MCNKSFAGVELLVFILGVRNVLKKGALTRKGWRKSREGIVSSKETMGAYYKKHGRYVHTVTITKSYPQIELALILVWIKRTSTSVMALC